MEFSFDNLLLTDDQLEDNIPAVAKEDFYEVFNEIKKPKRKTVDKLRRLIRKYPRVPEFIVALSSVYYVLGDEEKSTKATEILVERFPDYLEGKISLARIYLAEEAPQGMTELLGEQFNLKEVFPERSVFHVKEYLGIQGVAVGYHAHFGDLDEAERRLRLMHELGGESSEYVDAYVSYRAGLAKLVKARNEQEAKTNITPVHTL